MSLADRHLVPDRVRHFVFRRSVVQVLAVGGVSVCVGGIVLHQRQGLYFGPSLVGNVVGTLIWREVCLVLHFGGKYTVCRGTSSLVPRQMPYIERHIGVVTPLARFMMRTANAPLKLWCWARSYASEILNFLFALLRRYVRLTNCSMKPPPMPASVTLLAGTSCGVHE